MFGRLSTTAVVASALAVAVVASAAKIVVLARSPSSALFSSTAQSLIEALYLALLVLGVHQSRVVALNGARADVNAPYFWSFVVGILLYAMGAGLALHEGVERIAAPYNPVLAGYEVLVVAIAVAAAAAVCLLALETTPGERESAGESGLFSGVLRPERAPHTGLLAVSLGSVIGQVLALGGILGATSGGDVRSDAMASIAVGLTMTAVAAFMAIEVRRALAEQSPASVPAARDTAPVAVHVTSEAAVLEGLETKSAHKGKFDGVEPPPEEAALPEAVQAAGQAAVQSIGPATIARPVKSGTLTKPHVQVRQGSRKGGGKRRR